MNRKEIKKNAHVSVHTHRGILTIACAITVIVMILGSGVLRAELPENLSQWQGIFRSCRENLQKMNGMDMILPAVLRLFLIIFVFSLMRIVTDRLFLEARTYDEVPVQHGFYVVIHKKWLHTACAWLKRCFYHFLWSLTVIGGIIKYYSYFLVPFILAENPSLNGSEALTLSRKMMNGHKKEAFVLQLSLLPWFLLNLATCGIAGILYVNPYAEAVYAEYYAALRAEAKQRELPEAAVLQDDYLYEKAPAEELQKAYKDIRLDQRYVRMNAVKLQGLQGLAVRILGIWAGGEKKRRLYQGTEDIRLQSELDHKALEGKIYPSRLSVLYDRRQLHEEGKYNSCRAYPVSSLVLLFFVFSFTAWLFEKAGILPAMTEGLRGPWDPLYGTAGVIALLLTAGVREQLFWSWLINAAVFGYTVFFAQGNITVLQGVITAGFGFIGILHARAVGPQLESWFDTGRKPALRRLLALIVLALFAADSLL